jgi:recombination protein RecT
MATQNLPTTQQGRTDAIGALLSQDSIKKRFEQVLGKKAAGFMSSVISAVNANPELKKADPITVVSAAAVAASLDLPINPSLGFAHIVPYAGRAQFQMGWRGFVQLGMRSGQYKTINTCAVYEGELVESNRFTGEMYFDEKQRTSEKVIGYVSYFKLMNGFEKYLYMTVEQVQAHGKQYSKSYSNAKGKWQTDFESMALKTPLKLLLSRWGILSIEMQTAVQLDQATIKTIDGTAYAYDDNPESDGNLIDMETTEVNSAAIIKAFDESIPKGIDAAILNEFLTRTAESNKSTVEQVKIEGGKAPEKFWKIYAAYEKQMKNKKQKDPAPDEMASGPCPDNPETTYTKAYCQNCKKFVGCPVWGINGK